MRRVLDSGRPWILALAAVGLASLLSMASCDHRAVNAPRQQEGGAAVPVKPAGTLIVLPDSAIVVQPGSLEERLAHYLASPDPAPRTFRFNGVAFEPWASRPNQQTLRTMYALAQILRAYPNAMVTLWGYTDNVGTAEQNLAIAQQRVQRLKELLVQSGIREGRLTAVGRGAVNFIADNSTPAGQARNRRIELTITTK